MGTDNMKDDTAYQRSSSTNDTHIQIGSITQDEFDKMSFKDKVLALRSRRFIDRSGVKKGFYIATTTFWYACFSFVYLMFAYHIPELRLDKSSDAVESKNTGDVTIDQFSWSDIPNWRGYWLYVITWFLFFESAINWFFTTQYTSFYTSKQEDIPQLQKTLWEDYDKVMENLKPKREFVEGSNKLVYKPDLSTGQQWRRCIPCQDDIPPRAHHCSVCNRCVLKRDHHCYMTGVCIGFNNQRFFTIAVFYVGICCAIGLYLDVTFLIKYYFKTNLMTSYSDLFLPVTLYRTFVSRILPTHILIMISHFYIYPFVGAMSLTFFVTQMFIILRGRTMQEVKKSSPMTIHLSFNERFAEVFGPCWLLNFIFPTQLFFRPSGDGVHWPAMDLLTEGQRSSWNPFSKFDRNGRRHVKFTV